MEYIHYLVWFVCGFFCGATLMRDRINAETKRRYEEMLKDMKEFERRGYGNIKEIKEDDK